MKINGATVLVTGASSGIGAATARAMAHAGGRVLLLARTQSALEEIAGEITSNGGEAFAFPVDLADAEAVSRVAEAVTRQVGTPDVLINNAGAGRFLFIQETSPAEAVQIMAVPYFAAFYITRAFLPDMLRRGSGHIVNVTSPASRCPWPGATAYSAARWAMRGFSEALRADLHGTGVRVTLVSAGAVDNSYWDHNSGSKERIPKIAALIPTLTSERVAAAIVKAVERNQRQTVIPFMLRAFYSLHAVCPRLVEGLVVSTGWKNSG